MTIAEIRDRILRGESTARAEVEVALTALNKQAAIMLCLALFLTVR